jgi:hypothetical protein
VSTALPPQPVPEAGDTGTIYLFHGDQGALGFSVGEGDDAYVYWSYGTNEITSFAYDASGWARAWSAYSAGEKGHRAAVARTAGRRAAAWAELHECLFLGGYGYELVPRHQYAVAFDDAGVVVTDEARHLAVAEVPLGQLTGVEIGGPGAVTTNAGIIGGGFSLQGFLEGAAFASLINALSSRTEVQTVFRLEASGGELTFFYSGETPDQLRITLAQLFGHLRSKSSDGVVGNDRRVDPVERLAKLADLVERGLLSREEFDTAKVKLLDSL